MTSKKAANRPPILMIDTEADTLATLALSAEERHPQVSQLLTSEIERATILSAKKIPPNVVTMKSTVEFTDETNKIKRTVQLVYPQEADIAAGRISILTPVGAGLIGMQEGQSILWPDREGQERKLSIIKVTRARDEL